MADAIAAYMRGEIKSREFEKAAGPIDGPTDDEGADGAGLQMWYVYGDFIDHPVCVSREGWDYLRRWLAFLKTDYGLKDRKPRSWVYPRALPLLFLMGLLGSLAASITLGSWIVLAVGWLILGPAWYPIRRYKFRRDQALAESDRELNKLAETSPFLSAEDWRDHEALLDSCQLPEYDPSVHDVPFRDKEDERPDDGGPGMPWRLLGCIIVLPFMLISALFAKGSICAEYYVYLRTDNPQPEQPD